MTADNTGYVWTTVEYRPSARTTMDGPGRCAYYYGSDAPVLRWVADRTAMLTDTNQKSGRLICAHICARDAAGQAETRENQKDSDGFMPHVRRGQRGDRRLPKTAETDVVRLITQRSRVQIPPPLPVSAAQGPLPAGRGPFA
jgi:hypothetical protein